MSERPLIGTAWLKPDYRSALERAGARIRELTPNDSLPAALEACDGLLLTGGVDVEPALYGEPRHPTVETDRFVMRTSWRSRAKRWRGICRCSPSAAACRCSTSPRVARCCRTSPRLFQTRSPIRSRQPKNSIAHEVQGGSRKLPCTPPRRTPGSRPDNRRQQPASSVGEAGRTGLRGFREVARRHHRSNREAGCVVLSRRAVAPGELLADG